MIAILKRELKCMIAIFKREFKAYFLSPIGYIYMGFFLLLTGIFFTSGNLLPQNSRFSTFFGSLTFIYIFAVPLLTMRLFSEEKRQKTDQLLLTSPVSISGIVCGKFFAALILFAMTLVITLLYAVVIAIYGDFQWAETAGSYIGFLFMGAGYIAVGLFISAGTENQLTAALATFFTLFLLLVIDPVARMIPPDIRSGLISAGFLAALVAFFVFLNTRNWFITAGTLVLCALIIGGFWLFRQNVFAGFLTNFLGWFSLNRRYQSFTMGLLKFDALVYYASFCAFFLFLTVRIIEKRRWN
ncbi:MAG: ABC transporter permease subunit [Treponema sp.]|jgi:ABC-2 type transport system permease protein|nr:ABC transporter permease subunit [Treponema sp.]